MRLALLGRLTDKEVIKLLIFADAFFIFFSLLALSLALRCA
jgi:hypothetical protein